jgi:hypothetical protein
VFRIGDHEMADAKASQEFDEQRTNAAGAHNTNLQRAE